MDDYISREAAKKTHCDICMESCICYREKSTCDELRAFDLIPAADVRPVVISEDCPTCRFFNLEQGDTLYRWSDWDGGIGFDYIHNIRYCPVCGKELPKEEA